MVQLSRMNNGIKSARTGRVSPILCADVCLKNALEVKFSLNSGFYYYLFWFVSGLCLPFSSSVK